MCVCTCANPRVHHSSEEHNELQRMGRDDRVPLKQRLEDDTQWQSPADEAVNPVGETQRRHIPVVLQLPLTALQHFTSASGRRTLMSHCTRPSCIPPGQTASCLVHLREGVALLRVPAGVIRCSPLGQGRVDSQRPGTGAVFTSCRALDRGH